VKTALEHLEHLPRLAVLLIGLALIAAIALLDAVTGPKLSLNVFYLLPVMLVAWATASTIFGLIAVLGTFLVGLLQAYLDSFHVYSLPVALWNAGVRAAVFCVVLLLLAEVRRLVARFQEQSLTDELTGIANRRAFVQAAANEIERSLRFRHVLSLAYLDIDGFKAVNDRCGHVVGDRALVALAAAMRATARSVDTVARLGGDEFVVLMPETDEAASLPLADRLRQVCSRASGPGASHITCSVGVVTFGRAPVDVEELLTRGDALMYEAKAVGGDDVRHAFVGSDAPPASEASLLPLATGSGR
jgi:diguanylate cyclase (GGDEF)-like protein